MEEFWEKSFRINKEMWGWEPTLSAINTLSLFNEKGFNKILIPGFGYGRNAKLFIDFYDDASILRDFGPYGLIDSALIDEPKTSDFDEPKRGFWCVTCKKDV